MRTPITVFGGLPTDLPGDSLALYAQDFLKSEKAISNLQYIPEKDLAVDAITNPVGVLNHRGMFTSDHATLFYFGIENIGGLTLKAFSTQVSPQVSGQQFEVGVTASLFTKDGASIPLQALPMVPQTVFNPFVVAPQFADPTGAFSAPSLAVGDVIGDGTPELIVGNGIGLQPVVTVFDVRSLFVSAQSNPLGNQADFPLSSASILDQFFAYDSRFRGGVWVAAGKLDTDSAHVNKADIITGPGDGIGSQPLVEIWQNMASGEGVNMKLRQTDSSFFAYEPSFSGGVRVGVGNVTGASIPDIITAPGSGRSPLVEIFSGAPWSQSATGPQLESSFLAYDPSFTGGVFIAVGDYNQDGRADILTGPGLGAPAEVKVFSGNDLSILADLIVFQPPFPGKVTLFPDDSHWTSGVSGVAFGSLVQGPTGMFLEIVVGSGAGQTTRVRVIQSVPRSNTISSSIDLQLGLPASVFGAFVGGFEAGFDF
jgi:hypothetical protein